MRYNAFFFPPPPRKKMHYNASRLNFTDPVRNFRRLWSLVASCKSRESSWDFRESGSDSTQVKNRLQLPTERVKFSAPKPKPQKFSRSQTQTQKFSRAQTQTPEIFRAQTQTPEIFPRPDPNPRNFPRPDPNSQIPILLSSSARLLCSPRSTSFRSSRELRYAARLICSARWRGSSALRVERGSSALLRDKV